VTKSIKQAVAKLSEKRENRQRRAQSRVLPMVFHPDPRLNQASLEVVFETEEDLNQLIDDLIATMREQNGVGLAAIQVGVPKRLFVYASGEKDSAAHALINPCITHHADEEIEDEEGCLSFPGLYRPVKRSSSVIVEGFDRTGNPVTVRAEGFLARVFQHEIDHLDGDTFIEHLSDEDKRLALREYFDLP